MDIVDEIEALKREFMAPCAAQDPQMANVTLRLFGHLLGEYDQRGWEEGDRYHAVANAHLLRILHEAGVKLGDRWNYASSEAGGNLGHVFRFLLEQFQEDIGENVISHWSGDDYWDDCYILLALLEGRSEIADYDASLVDDFEHALEVSLTWLAEKAVANFPNAGTKEWSGPGFHAATLQLFHAVVQDAQLSKKSHKEVIDAVAANLHKLLAASLGKEEHWDRLYAWHIGQVITTWCQLSPHYASLGPLKPLIDAYYAEMIGPARRSAKEGWNNRGGITEQDRVIYCTARALAAAYLMEEHDDVPVIREAHEFIIAQIEEGPLLSQLKGCVNVLEALQLRMRCRLPDPGVHLTLQIGARLTITGLYDAVLRNTRRLTNRNKTATLMRVRAASRDALESSGRSAMQPLGVNGELMKFVRSNNAVIDQFDGGRLTARNELETFLSATMTEVRAKTARSLLRKLWTRPGLLHYVPFFEHLADLEHMQSFFADYRDHVNHQILVFLLGAYMYYKDSRLRDRVLQEIDWTNEEYASGLPPADDGEFLFRWKMAATFHDVGYIFEVSPRGPGAPSVNAIVAKSVQFIHDWIEDFLLEYLLHYDVSDKAAARAIVDRIRPQMPAYKNVKGIDDTFKLVQSTRGDAFAMMSSLLPDDLGRNLLPGYFKMCRNADPDANPDKKRSRYYDHGIMSAAILLKTANVQHHRLTALRDLADQGKLDSEPKLRAILKDETTVSHLQRARFFVRFAHVAGAIALHNVYPKLYLEKTCGTYGLSEIFYDEASSRHFRITPDTPLAYLMAFADGLQDWDRHSFRPPSVADKTNENPLSSHEILLRHDGAILKGVGLNPQSQKRFRERLAEMRITMRSLDEFVTAADSIP